MTTTSSADTVWDSLSQVLHRHAARTPDKIALRFLERGEGEGICRSYREFDLRVRALAVRLIEAGARGQTVLLVFSPGLGFAEAFCACLYAGAIAVPTPYITPARSAPRIAAIAADASPCVVLADARLAEDATIRAAFPPDLADIPWLLPEQVAADAADAWSAPPLGRDDTAFLQYTSGSTGTPRGVMVSHGNLIANLEMIRTAFHHDANTRMVSWLPLFHDMGLVGGLLQPLYVGGLAVLMSPLDFVQRPLRWLQAISRFGATSSGGPNFAYALCAERIRPQQLEGLDLRSWRVAFCGAEPVRAEVLRRFAERLAPVGFAAEALFPCYGLAEATLFVSGGPAGSGLRLLSQTAEVKPGSNEIRDRVACGELASGQLVAIVDPHSLRRVPEGAVGEVWVSGPHVGAGYWGQLPESEAGFRARLADDETAGLFLRTGDLGMMQGRELAIVGRLKEVLIVRGSKHAPEDIETTASHAHPAFSGGCAAFAVERDGEEGLVILQEVGRQHLSDPELGRLAAVLSGAVCDAHGVRPIEVCLLRPGSLPRTTSNKIRRGACREAFLSGDLSPLSIPSSDHCSSGLMAPAPSLSAVEVGDA